MLYFLSLSFAGALSFALKMVPSAVCESCQTSPAVQAEQVLMSEVLRLGSLTKGAKTSAGVDIRR